VTENNKKQLYRKENKKAIKKTRAAFCPEQNEIARRTPPPLHTHRKRKDGIKERNAYTLTDLIRGMLRRAVPVPRPYTHTNTHHEKKKKRKREASTPP
jgi:hypothetical protein